MGMRNSAQSAAAAAGWGSPRSAVAVSYWASGEGFLTVLLLASIGPFIAPLLAIPIGWSGAVAGYALGIGAVVVAISNAHVFATFYLLWDRTQLQGVERPAFNLVVVPLAISAVIVGLSIAYPALATAVIVVIVGFYGSYHFGRQNLGVHTFACRIASGRSMDAVERKTIVAGIICPLLSGAAVGIPALVRFAGLDPGPIAKLCATLNVLGWTGYIALTGVVIWHVVRQRAQYDWRSLTTYLIGVYFFLPGAISVLFAGALVVAHGLQYMVFLAYHGLGAARLKLAPSPKAAGISRPALVAVLSPFVTLAAWTLLGHGLFKFVNTPTTSLSIDAFAIDHKQAITYVSAAVTSVTVSHYWVDQHLWRFRSPERRAWFARYYAFLTPSRSGRPA